MSICMVTDLLQSIITNHLSQFSPGKDMLVSDNLSRSHFNHSKTKFIENTLIHQVNFVLSNLPISQTHLKQFQLETKNNSILQTLITYRNHQ